jgi:hypothetical protein
VMPTFLTTSRMSPALRARVQASVSGRRIRSQQALSPRSIAALRALAVVSLLGGLTAVALHVRRVDHELEATRSTLLAHWQRESAGLSPRHRALGTRVQRWLAEASGSQFEDEISAELRLPQGLQAVLARPIVYVRGDLADVRTLTSLENTARESVKDAFVLCLMDPPEQRSERTLLSRVRSAYAGGERMQRATGHVVRLGDGLMGLPLLDQGWRVRIAEARDRRELEQLRRTFERAPLERAKFAAKASVLLFAIDEPGDAAKPTELDGERPHHVRIGLVDLERDKVLLKLRRHVDPSWLSDTTRAEYARGVDSCALALDVRSALTQT